MQICSLDLGQSPWERLAEGRTHGVFQWGEGDPLPVSVRIRGAHSRRFPRKSLQVDFKGCRLPDEPPAGHTVRRLHLNADYVDPTRMRSALSFRLFDQVGAPAPLCRHVFLTVSGETMGIYLALESVDSDFCRRRGWQPGPIYYAINRNADFGLISTFSGELKQPLDTGYRPVERADTGPLCQMLSEINLATLEEFPRVVRRWVDVEGYFRWLMVAVFVGNRDGFVHNYALYREPIGGRFRIIPWDYDATWGIDIHGRPARLDRVPVIGWNRLTERLLTVPEYRRLYRRLFCEALDGPLSPPAVLPLIDGMAAMVADRIDPDRQTQTAFAQGVTGLKQWAEDRRSLLLQELAGL
jgi:spore coat protein H